MDSPPAGATPADIRGYISDMLSQLADLARRSGDRWLETSMRLLAVEAAAGRGRDPEA